MLRRWWSASAVAVALLLSAAGTTLSIALLSSAFRVAIAGPDREKPRAHRAGTRGPEYCLRDLVRPRRSRCSHVPVLGSLAPGLARRAPDAYPLTAGR